MTINTPNRDSRRTRDGAGTTESGAAGNSSVTTDRAVDAEGTTSNRSRSGEAVGAGEEEGSIAGLGESATAADATGVGVGAAGDVEVEAARSRCRYGAASR